MRSKLVKSGRSTPRAGPAILEWSPDWPNARIRLHMVLWVWLASAPTAWAATISAGTERPLIQVGPGKSVRTIGEAARLAVSGSLVEVDAGEYVADVAVWTQDALTIRAVGGRVHLRAAGASAEAKAIWVIRGGNVTVEGFDFTESRVPDRNGAGIRLESGKLLVRDCRFINNESGILTSNGPQIELEIVDSEFAHNGFGDGQSHNLYAGSIARLTVYGSHFHHAKLGHLIKSRAAVNEIRYNRLVDGPGGRASYELEFASGGMAYVVGNTIEQGEQTENPTLVSFGAEGLHWRRNGLYLIHNILVNRKLDDVTFLRIRRGWFDIQVVSNLFVGAGRSGVGPASNHNGNARMTLEAFDAATRRIGPMPPGARSRPALVDPGTVQGVLLQRQSQYQNPAGTKPLIGKPHNPGAFQTGAPPR